jgi:hypothetical protein
MLLVFLFCHSPAFAIQILESDAGDAGETLTTAQVLEAGTTVVVGTTSLNDKIDLFSFGWAGGDFSANTSSVEFDTQLYLFDSAGFGIQANDDRFITQNILSISSGLFVSGLAAGNYFVAVSEQGYDPLSIDGYIFPDLFIPFSIFPPRPGDLVEPTGPGGSSPLIDWGYRGFQPLQLDNRVYRLNFASSPTAGMNVPLPPTSALFGLGLLGVAYWRRKRVRLQ